MFDTHARETLVNRQGFFCFHKSIINSNPTLLDRSSEGFSVYGLQVRLQIDFSGFREYLLSTMTTNEAVNEIARLRIVENIVNRVTSSGETAQDPSSLSDLIQDIYLSLLEDSKIASIYEEGHANFYIARIVTNNICSSSSRYYRNYLLPKKRNVSINEAITTDIDGTEN